MIGKTNGGAGGSSLNYKVIAYPDEVTLLAATPAENTIGVVTTTPITARVFSAIEPQSLIDGAVWFCTGTVSTVAFNALKSKKDAVMVYPLSAKQYVSGAWADVTCKSYQGGKWVDWIYTVKNLDADHWISTGTTSRATISDADEGLLITFKTGNWQYVGGYVDEKINLSNRKTVVFSGENTGMAETVQLCVYDEDKSIVASVTLLNGSNSNTVNNNLEDYPVDCSGLSGEYYAGIYASVGSYVGSINIKSITLK